MPDYRVCLFDSRGFNRRSFFIECAGDSEACALGVAQLKPAELVEVWKRDRLVCGFSMPPELESATSGSTLTYLRPKGIAHRGRIGRDVP